MTDTTHQAEWEKRLEQLWHKSIKARGNDGENVLYILDGGIDGFTALFSQLLQEQLDEVELKVIGKKGTLLAIQNPKSEEQRQALETLRKNYATNQ